MGVRQLFFAWHQRQLGRVCIWNDTMLSSRVRYSLLPPGCNCVVSISRGGRLGCWGPSHSAHALSSPPPSLPRPRAVFLMCQTLIRCTWWRSLAVVICRARETWCDRRLEETKEGSTVIVEAMFVYVAVESQLLRVG